MGNTYIVAKAMLDDLGVDYIIPQFNNKKALELGTRYAPELACLPLKINLGNFIQAYEKGADTILITGGCGPCRFGYYCEMHKEILRDIGYDMNVITLEITKKNKRELIENIKCLASGLNPYRITRTIINTTEVAKMVDNLEKMTYKVRPREINKGETDRIYKVFRSKVLNTNGSENIKKLIKDTGKKLLEIKKDEHFKPLKIGIVGEIYTTIDSYSSFNIDIKLENMGVEVDRKVTVSGWIIEHMIKKALHLKRDLRYVDAAKPYLGAMIGGHAQETVGNTVLYAKDDYDGIIQIYPLTCMPEIVAQSILPNIEKDYGIPILTLIIDEMTGEAGYMTRLEAFVDLLEKRRERKTVGEENLLYGN